MTLVISNLPVDVDAALRRRSSAEGKPLEEVAMDAMRAGLGLSTRPEKRRDLSDIAGTWVEDPEFDAAMAEQDEIGPETWQ